MVVNQEAFAEAYGHEAAKMRLKVVENYRDKFASNPDSEFFQSNVSPKDKYAWNKVSLGFDMTQEYLAEIERQMRDAAAMRSFPANPSGISPTEFKCLVLPKPTESITKGGIILPDEDVDKKKFATTEGTLIASSPLAFTYASDDEWGDNKPVPGDRIIYERYAGVSIKGKDGVEYILINDKSIFAKAEF